jgi:hypothetical protein
VLKECPQSRLVSMMSQWFNEQIRRPSLRLARLANGSIGGTVGYDKLRGGMTFSNPGCYAGAELVIT